VSVGWQWADLLQSYKHREKNRYYVPHPIREHREEERKERMR